MYDKHIIVGGQSSTALTLFWLTQVQNCAQMPKKKTNKKKKNGHQ